MKRITEVSTRELKSRLSQYLRLVREGRPVTVMRHGQAIAEILPMGSSALRPETYLLAGTLTRARRPFRLPERTLRLKRKGKTVAQIILEDRR